MKAPRNTCTCTVVVLYGESRAQRKFQRARGRVQISANNPPHCHRATSSDMLKEYGIFFRKILQIINTDDDFCSLLSVAVSKEETSACVNHLITLFVQVSAPATVYNDNNDIFGTFLSYCNLASSTPHIGQKLRQAIKSRKRICSFRRNYHRKII